jgi:hypothetical protein
MKRIWRCYTLTATAITAEGNFEQLSRTKTRLVLRLIQKSAFTSFPNAVVREIPLGKARRTAFCPSVHRGKKGTLVVHHEGDKTPFIYDPH